MTRALCEVGFVITPGRSYARRDGGDQQTRHKTREAYA